MEGICSFCLQRPNIVYNCSGNQLCGNSCCEKCLASLYPDFVQSSCEDWKCRACNITEIEMMDHEQEMQFEAEHKQTSDPFEPNSNHEESDEDDNEEELDYEDIPKVRKSGGQTSGSKRKSIKKPVKTKRSSRTTRTESAQDPLWAELALKYLAYAKVHASRMNAIVDDVRQLPSITHMIAVPTDESEPQVTWRWCDAYHAIKYMKDTNLVTTSRGAKGTSIRDDGYTIDDLIRIIQYKKSDFNEQGQIKPLMPDVLVTARFKGLPVNSEIPLNSGFDMQIGDIREMESVLKRAVNVLKNNCCEAWTASARFQLSGYLDRDGPDYIHSNEFTSVDELHRDASELYFLLI